MAVIGENEAAQILQLQNDAASGLQMLLAAVGRQRIRMDLPQGAAIGLVGIVAGQSGLLAQQGLQR